MAVHEGSALQRSMVAAVLDGAGPGRIAELASAEAGVPIAIVLPRGGAVVAATWTVSDGVLSSLADYAAARATGERPERPDAVIADAPVTMGGGLVGMAFALEGGVTAAGDQLGEILEATAMATLTEIALREARDDALVAARASLIERIRSDQDLSEGEIVRRASGLGGDLGDGATAVCVEFAAGRGEDILAIVRGEQPRALAEQVGARIYALLPPGSDGRRLEEVLEPYGTVGFSSFCRNPAHFHRAITEAELVVEVLTHEAGGGADDIASPTYRLLINTLAKRPDEALIFYEETVAPLVVNDEAHDTALTATAEAYLRNNCNVSATAANLKAHRQTVTSRLEQIRELTGLDPKTSEGCERLSLGLKLHRILAPRLGP